MSTTVVIATAIPSILSGVTLLIITRYFNKSDKRADAKAKREELMLQALDALMDVTKELTACVLEGKTPNGDLHEAYNYKQRAKHDLELYERQQAAK